MRRIYKYLLHLLLGVSTKTRMETTFDPAKDAANIVKHGLSLADFAGFDADPITLVDDRFDYGETRFRALGSIDGAAHVIVYAVAGEALRLISFRRAHAKEGRQYERRNAAP